MYTSFMGCHIKYVVLSKGNKEKIFRSRSKFFDFTQSYYFEVKHKISLNVSIMNLSFNDVFGKIYYISERYAALVW